MSEKQTVSSSSTKGKGTTIVVPATQSVQAIAGLTNVVLDPPPDDIFIIAGKIEELLKGKSNRTCKQVLNMVGSIHGIRAIPADRPIGQSTTGTTKVVPIAKTPEKGKPTPPAAWKQTNHYRELSTTRALVVKTIKSLPDGPQKQSEVAKLRDLEQQLKSLRAATAGEH